MLQPVGWSFEVLFTIHIIATICFVPLPFRQSAKSPSKCAKCSMHVTRVYSGSVGSLDLGWLCLDAFHHPLNFV